MTGEQNTINEYVPDAAELTPKAAWRPVAHRGANGADRRPRVPDRRASSSTG